MKDLLDLFEALPYLMPAVLVLVTLICLLGSWLISRLKPARTVKVVGSRSPGAGGLRDVPVLVLEAVSRTPARRP